MEPAPLNGPYPHDVGAGATVGRFVAESEVHSGKATDHAVGRTFGPNLPSQASSWPLRPRAPPHATPRCSTESC